MNDRIEERMCGRACECGVCPLCRARQMLDRWEHGRQTRGKPQPRRSGEQDPQAKLTAEQVRWIRKRAAAGERTCTIRRDFPQVKPGALYDIVNGRTWPNVV